MHMDRHKHTTHQCDDQNDTLPKLMQAEKIAWNFKSGHRKELVLELYKEVEN